MEVKGTFGLQYAYYKVASMMRSLCGSSLSVLYVMIFGRRFAMLVGVSLLTKEFANNGNWI